MFRILRWSACAATALALGACSNSDNVADEPVELQDIDYRVEMAQGGEFVVSETDESASLVVLFDGGAPRSFRITYRIIGDPDDVETGEETVAVAAGTESVPLTVRPIDDERIENDEDIRIAFSADDSRFVSREITLTIQSDDLPYVLTGTTETVVEPDRGASEVSLRIGLDRPAVGEIVVPFTVTATALTEGDDYTPIEQGSVTFADGESESAILVTLLGDDLNEQTGSLAFAFVDTNEVLIDSDSAPAQLFVEDFEPEPVVRFEVAEQTASERAGLARVRVFVEPPSDQALETRVDITGSAGPGVDYNLPPDFDRFVIPARGTSATVDITLIAEDTPEGNETIRLALQPPAFGSLGEPNVHTVTLFGDVALNDTGVRTRIDGAGPGQDADHGRDAKLNRTAFSFTKIDLDGNPVPDSAPPGTWDCVRDNVTGLTWEARSRNINTATGQETPFVRVENEPDFDIDGDGRPDVNTQPAIGGDDWRAWNARYYWRSEIGRAHV